MEDESFGEVFKIDAGRIMYEPNAVDVDEFDSAVNKDEARRNLALPLDKKIAMYTGHLYGWKGVDTWHRQSPSSRENVSLFLWGEQKKTLKVSRESTAMIPVC